MLTIKQLQSALNACRGTGRWAELAKLAGCHYDTICRIARGVHRPNSALLEKLSAALTPARKAKAEAAQ
jgi:hypothetical protein